MKKTILVLMICSLLLGGAFSAQAAAACSVKLEGDKSVLAGTEITIKLFLNGTALSAVQGMVQYDSAQLQYKGFSGKPSGWAVEPEDLGGKISIIANDNSLEKPLNGYKQLVSLRFTVKKNLVPGSAIVVTAAGFSCSDGETDFSPANHALRITVKAPPSGENRLASLSTPDGALQPAFSPAITQYSLSVPFEISRLTLNTAAQHEKATVKISTSSLRVGKNVIRVTVTAESKSVKTYTLNVERAADPNAPTKATTTAASTTDGTSAASSAPSGSSAPAAAPGSAVLKEIRLDAGILSPAFSPENTQYIVYLPYETQTLTLRGIPLESAAHCDALELTALPVGDTLARLTVTAPNGKEAAYELLLRRLPQYIPGETQGAEATEPKMGGLPYFWLALLLPLCIAVGAGGMWVLGRRRKSRQ